MTNSNDLFEQIKAAIMAMPLDNPNVKDRGTYLVSSEPDSGSYGSYNTADAAGPDNLTGGSWGEIISPKLLAAREASVEEPPAISPLSSSSVMTVSAKYEIEPQGHKGLGMKAIRDIETNETICEEGPILVCPSGASSPEEMEALLRTAMASIPADDRDFIMHGLTNAKQDGHQLSGRYSTNALPCSHDSGAIFKNLAMANHSCGPNAEYRWNEASGTGTLFAVQPIATGAEITISYVPLEPHAARRRRLQDAFGFLCDCWLCRLPEPRRQAEDRRIVEIGGLELFLQRQQESQLYQYHGGQDRLLQQRLDERLEKFATLAHLYRESEVNRQGELAALRTEVVAQCLLYPDEGLAIRRIMEICQMGREEAEAAYKELDAALDTQLPTLESGLIEDLDDFPLLRLS